jgi:hypothetical protein
MPTNPYQTTSRTNRGGTGVWSLLEIVVALVWLTCYFYPAIALGGIYIVVFMHDVLKMGGAIIGSYETPMGVVFNLSVFVLIGVLYIVPIGLILSFLPPRLIRRIARPYTGWLPLGFMLIAIWTIAMVFWDPWGVVEIYAD